MHRIVVLGAGQAGVELAHALRSGGFAGRIALVGAEPGTPYERPPLSKDFMTGPSAEVAPLRPEGFFREQGIELLSDRRAVAVDPAARTVTLHGGAARETLGYDELVFATGARNRELPLPGGELDGVLSLRGLDDARALRSRLALARQVVVVGAGFVGLEFAAAARSRGAEVTVLESAARPMSRVVSPTMSEHFARAHAGLGISLRLDEGVREIAGRPGRKGLSVLSSTGAAYPADLVLSAVGILPEDRLAGEAGLSVGDGILVDGQLRASIPHISAIGDCARYPSVHALAGARLVRDGRIRLESVQNATDQGRYLARRLLGVAQEPYTELPWFWTHQGPLRLYIAGLVEAGDRAVIRGDPATGEFSVFCFREDRLSGVESLNRPADHIAARKILAAGRSVTPAQAADLDFDLRAFSRRQDL